MTPPANPTPADARALAEEAIRLAEAATPGPWHVSNSFDIECDTCGEIPYVCDLTAEHEDGTAYQSLSMQFCGLESLAKPNAALVAHAGTHYATLARALLAALDEREALLADLPHAVGECDCKPERIPSKKQFDGATWTGFHLGMPEAHRAAIDRLRAGEE